MKLRVHIDLQTERTECSTWLSFLNTYPCNEHTHRTRISESIAFSYLELQIDDLICSEHDLAKQYTNTKIPEGIFRYNNKIVSVEAKRITCSHPRSKSQTWQWNKTVQNAMQKGVGRINDEYNVQEHIIVFELPSTLEYKKKQRAVRHILLELHAYYFSQNFPRTTACIITAPPRAFNKEDLTENSPPNRKHHS